MYLIHTLLFCLTASLSLLVVIQANPVPYHEFRAAAFGVQRLDDGYLKEVERMRAEGLDEVRTFLPFVVHSAHVKLSGYENVAGESKPGVAHKQGTQRYSYRSFKGWVGGVKDDAPRIALSLSLSLLV